MAFNGARLKELRMLRGLSIYELSFETGLERTTISRLEKGIYKDPNFITVAKIADYLKVNMETFKKGKFY